MSVALRCACVLALVLASAAPLRAATCTASGRVTLASDAVDPDVFLWDSRTRLVDYAAGQWGNTRAIFAHTMLAEPGTKAIVVACVPAVAHPKFGFGNEDAIGVKVLSGAHRGRYGWVLSSDIHMRVTGSSSGSVAGATAQTRP